MSVFVNEPLEAVLELHFGVCDLDVEESSILRALDEAEEMVDQRL